MTLDSLISDRPPFARHRYNDTEVADLHHQLQGALARPNRNMFSIAQMMASLIEQTAGPAVVQNLAAVLEVVATDPNARDCILMIASKTFVEGQYRKMCREVWDRLPDPPQPSNPGL